MEVPSIRHFAQRLSIFVLFRQLQVLGAYGFRGYFEHKQHFIDSIPPAIQNIRDLLALREDVLPYPYLRDVMYRLTQLPQFAPKQETVSKRADGYRTTDRNIYVSHPQDGPATYSKYDGKGPLVVRVYSFLTVRVFLLILQAMVVVMCLIVGRHTIPVVTNHINSLQDLTSP